MLYQGAFFMKIAEVLLADFDPEINSTQRILRLVPETDPQWKPHPKSMPIGRLAMHTATLPKLCSIILSTPEMDMSKDKWPDFTFESTAQLLSVLEATSQEARKHLAASSDEDLQKNWRLAFQGKTLAEGPRLRLYRSMFLNHLIHHRAQVGLYLRLLEIPLPGIYGPSADEPFTP
jgi:uncharacterized damage-inducible protein DinB